MPTKRKVAKSIGKILSCYTKIFRRVRGLKFIIDGKKTKLVNFMIIKKHNGPGNTIIVKFKKDIILSISEENGKILRISLRTKEKNILIFGKQN